MASFIHIVLKFLSSNHLRMLSSLFILLQQRTQWYQQQCFWFSELMDLGKLMPLPGDHSKSHSLKNQLLAPCSLSTAVTIHLKVLSPEDLEGLRSYVLSLLAFLLSRWELSPWWTLWINCDSSMVVTDSNWLCLPLWSAILLSPDCF